jgi:hypothetical protein
MSSGAEKVIFQTSVSCTETTYFPVENNFPWYPLYSRVQGDSLKFPKRNSFQHFLSLLVAHSDFYMATYMSPLGDTCTRVDHHLVSFLYHVLVFLVPPKVYILQILVQNTQRFLALVLVLGSVIITSLSA